MRNSGVIAGCAILSVTCSMGASLLWGPYLQDVRQDRATVMWTTHVSAGAGSVRHFIPSGPAYTPSVVTPLPAAQTGLSEDLWLHRAVLRQLEAGTKYGYQVLLDGQVVADNPAQQITTSGAPPFRFLVIGDTGDNGAGQRLLADTLQRESASFLLHAGDIAYWEGTFPQYQHAFFEIYSSLLLRMAAFTTLGNHDAPADAIAYRTLFSPPQENVPADSRGLYYSFDWANVHFTVLDSNESLTRSLAGTGKMLTWLEQDLKSTRQIWRVVVVHHPAFPSTDYKRNDPVCKVVLDDLTPIFERNGVQVVFSGHEHIYQRTQGRRAGVFMPQGPGTVYVTTGGGGSQYYDPGHDLFLAAAAGGAHYLRVDVSDTAFRVEAVDPDGKRLDLWELSPVPALLPNGILDSAAYQPAIAPGGLISLFGWNLAERESVGSVPLPSDLGGASVRIDGRSIPLHYASRTQINAQIPFDLAAGSYTITATTRQGWVSQSASVQAVAPAIFELTVGGRTIAAALHSDGRLVRPSAPGEPDEWVSVYATGLGRVTGDFPTGVPAPQSPLIPTAAVVTAQIGGVPAEASQACLAPGFVGLYQVNVRVPRGLRPGPNSLQLFAASQPGNRVTLDLR